MVLLLLLLWFILLLLIFLLEGDFGSFIGNNFSFDNDFKINGFEIQEFKGNSKVYSLNLSYN